MTIECAPTAVVLHLDVDGTVVTVRARRFEDIDFISYRDDLRGNLSCGRRAALDAVTATFRSDPSVVPHVGTAVAVEFVPKGYVPPRP